ncbi:LysR substrate-binding domain-containing protein [Citricoccus sp. GCM10030269]|uniref:LysR family transcriptional regulator n=1 Tax=Citricoccus sp. GCM10030269 TaxID=3273388 RepID=UPI00361588DE
MELSLRRLRMLRELHRRGTVTAVGAALHYSPSGVSQQLAQLERDVGVPLVERHGRRLQLTELGLVLAEHAEEILGSVDRATMALEEAQEGVTARLTAGVWASVASGLLPQALTILATSYPGIEVRTVELDPEETAGAVKDGTLDFSFVIDYSVAPEDWDPALTRAGIAVERLHAAVPAGMIPTETVGLSQLADYPWILAGPRSQFGNAVRLACHRRGFDPRIAHTVAEQPTALAMAAGGLGVTLVSDLALELLPPGVDIVALDEPVIRTVSLAYRKTPTRRPSIQLVLDAVRTAAAEKGLAGSSTLLMPGIAD